MTTKPSGTLFFRGDSPRHHSTTTGVYGLLSLPATVAGEHLYIGQFARRDNALGLALNLDDCMTPDFGAALPDGHDLGHLARRAMWGEYPLMPGSCHFYLRESGIASPASGEALYIAVAVVRADSRRLPFPTEHLLDFKDGAAAGPAVAVSSIGLQPQQVLRAPFYLTSDGDRRALPSTTGPQLRAALLAINRITAAPAVQRSPADIAQLDAFRANPEFRSFVLLRERKDERDFQAFAAAMRALPPIEDRLVTAAELAERCTFAADVIKAGVVLPATAGLSL